MVAQNEALYFEPKLNVFDRNSCLTKQRPLVIETIKGQKLKMVLRSLKHLNEHGKKLPFLQESCIKKLGYILSKHGSFRNTTICSNAFIVKESKSENTRLSPVFETNDNNLNMYFLEDQKNTDVLIGVEGYI